MLSSPATLSRFARLARDRPLQTDVENRVTFGAEAAEFAVYDTVRPAERVPLRAANPLYCGMVAGRKLVHTASGGAIPFLPAESLVVPSGETITIDFPGASDASPTTCLTVEIDRARVRGIVDALNETTPRSADSGAWAYADRDVCHFRNSPGIDRTLGQLVGLFLDGDPDRDLLIDLAVQQLVVRMLRAESRALLLGESSRRASANGLAAAAELARRRLAGPLRMADLAAAACMSESAFYRAFQNEFGQTPLAFLTGLRVERAQALLADRRRSVTDVAAAVGFESVSHFIRVYRAHVGRTPKQDQMAGRAEA